MTELIVNKGDRYTVDPLFQWDINQTLKIHGLSLASDPKIHFSTEVLNGAIVRQATRDSKGIITVKIPNSLLQKPYKIDVFVCVYEGETFQSLYKMSISVNARKRPFDYTLEDTDEEIYFFNKLENQLYETLKTLTLTCENALLDLQKSGAENLARVNQKADETLARLEQVSVPAGVTAIDVFLVGGGGGSGQDYTDGYSGAGGGYTQTYKSIPTSPGTQWNVLVGAGGDNSNGATSSFSNGGGNYTASGGNRSGQYGANGGSGGGGAGQYSIYAGNGGSDGSKGEDARKVGTATGVIKTGGAGQGTTTRAFGEPNGTLYAGGGGGSWSPSGHTGAVGQGGAGGGGRGRNNDNSGNIDGTNGTPNTGGGSGGFSGAKVNGQGGSGIVIVRWGY